MREAAHPAPSRYQHPPAWQPPARTRPLPAPACQRASRGAAMLLRDTCTRLLCCHPLLALTQCPKCRCCRCCTMQGTMRAVPAPCRKLWRHRSSSQSVVGTPCSTGWLQSMLGGSKACWVVAKHAGWCVFWGVLCPHCPPASGRQLALCSCLPTCLPAHSQHLPSTPLPACLCWRRCSPGPGLRSHSPAAPGAAPVLC